MRNERMGLDGARGRPGMEALGNVARLEAGYARGEYRDGAGVVHVAIFREADAPPGELWEEAEFPDGEAPLELLYGEDGEISPRERPEK